MGHGRRVAGVANAALAIEQDEATVAADALVLIQQADGRSGCRLRRHAASDKVQGAAGEEQADEVLAMASAGDAAQAILGTVAAADQGCIANASGMLGGDAAGG